LWRFRAPLSSSEIRRTERWLATARVSLTTAALVTLWMEPARGVGLFRGLFWLLTVYLVHAVVVMLLVRVRRQSTRSFRLVVHGADIMWPVLMTLFTTAQRGPFFSVFRVREWQRRRYRWGLWETVGTANRRGALVVGRSVGVHEGLEQTANAYLGAIHLRNWGCGNWIRSNSS